MPRPFPTSAFAMILFACSATACGGDEPPPKDASNAGDHGAKDDGGPSVVATSEIGGMNEDDVDAAFKSSVNGLMRCLDAGAKRVEFLGGSVAFVLKIDATGKVSNAYLEHSTLGDRTTERCMLDALAAKTWPKPVGGAHGLARKSFSFDPPNDVRPPVAWDEQDAAPGLKKIDGDVTSCKAGHQGPFEATLYVDTAGKVLAASVTPPDEDGSAAVDCLVDALKSATFPSPGSWPAKVTVEL